MHHFVEFFIKHLGMWAVFFLSLSALIYFEVKDRSGGMQRVTTQQLTEMVNYQHGIVVDVRDANSYQQGHIIGSKNLPKSQLSQHLKSLERYQQRPLIIVTAADSHPTGIAPILREQGFDQLYYLPRGIGAWQEANLPLQKG